jgi:two-component system, NarL family, nitrate/nitrite response regulator NarL
MRCVRVVIADRHPVMLQGLSSVLEVQRDFRVVARCGDGATCINAIRNFLPDIAILNVSMSGIGGLEILDMARSENLATRLVFFNAPVEERELEMLEAAGAHAFISDEVHPEVLVQTLRQVADGERLLPLSSSDQVVHREQSPIAEKPVAALTDRERQIMRLVSEGLSNKEIGRRLSLSDGTIKVHLHHIFQKLEIYNRTALAALAISQYDNSDPPLGK